MKRLRDLIMRHEGLRLQVYDDATGDPIIPGSHVQGHPTIGYGIALDVGGITEAEAQGLLENRVLQCLHEMNRTYSWFEELSAVRQAVVVSMAYQLGMGGFRQFRKMIAALEAHDYSLAAAEMLDSDWGKNDTPERAKELAGMMLSGNWPQEGG